MSKITNVKLESVDLCLNCHYSYGSGCEHPDPVPEDDVSFGSRDRVIDCPDWEQAEPNDKRCGDCVYWLYDDGDCDGFDPNEIGVCWGYTEEDVDRRL